MIQVWDFQVTLVNNHIVVRMRFIKIVSTKV